MHDKWMNILCWTLGYDTNSEIDGSDGNRERGGRDSIDGNVESTNSIAIGLFGCWNSFDYVVSYKCHIVNNLYRCLQN